MLQKYDILIIIIMKYTLNVGFVWKEYGIWRQKKDLKMKLNETNL